MSLKYPHQCLVIVSMEKKKENKYHVNIPIVMTNKREGLNSDSSLSIQYYHCKDIQDTTKPSKNRISSPDPTHSYLNTDKKVKTMKMVGNDKM